MAKEVQDLYTKNYKTERKEKLNKTQISGEYAIFMGQNIYYCQFSMIYRVKGISIKILAAYFIEIDKLSL